MTAAENALRADPTVIDHAERMKIENYTGMSLQESEPEAIQFVVERSKKAGNISFKEKRYKGISQAC